MRTANTTPLKPKCAICGEEISEIDREATFVTIHKLIGDDVASMYVCGGCMFTEDYCNLWGANKQ